MGLADDLRGLMARFRALYGSTPLHLIALAASLALTAFTALKIAEYPTAFEIALWLVGAALVHDLVLFPLYTLLGLLAGGNRPRRATNFVRVPAMISGLLFLMFVPLICSLAPDSYEGASGLRPEPYLERWLAITAVLFLASGLLYALRARRSAS
jgi:Kef-type K+ transport system membrane component KefB